MEIQGKNSGPESSKNIYEQRQRALIEANRALVRAVREDLTAVAQERLARLRETREAGSEAAARAPERRDELALSSAAIEASERSTAEREARVRELSEAHRMERLHTPERIERAAQRLLEG